MVVFGQKLLYSGKVVVFVQNWLYSNQSGSIQAKVVVFGLKMDVFGQKWLYLCKVVKFGQKLL